MQVTEFAKELGMTTNIFGFSHSREVVAALSRAGAFGVLGIANRDTNGVLEDLRYLEEACEGRPYGLDVIVPERYEHHIDDDSSTDTVDTYRERIPEEYWEFIERFAKEHDLPELDEAERQRLEWVPYRADRAIEQVHEAMSFPSCRMIVNALGTPPKQIIDVAHENGRLVGALAGRSRHAQKHEIAGLDFVIAQGTEAAGHTGEITTMVVVPDIVDAVSIPVLAAGGIASGRQIVAALALGAVGVWMGSAWLGSREDQNPPELKQVYLAAESHQTVRTRDRSGKFARKLENAWTRAWTRPDAPEPLPSPLQAILVHEVLLRVQKTGDPDLMYAPAGMVIGRVKEADSVESIVGRLVRESDEVLEALLRLR